MQEESLVVGYCKKCGFIGGVVFNKKCKNCGTKLNLLSEEMKQKYRIFNDEWSALVFEIRKLNTDQEKSKRIEELLSRTILLKMRLQTIHCFQSKNTKIK